MPEIPKRYKTQHQAIRLLDPTEPYATAEVCAFWLEEIGAAEALNRELRDALRRYGKHEADCHGWPTFKEELCSCKFAAALALGPPLRGNPTTWEIEGAVSNSRDSPMNVGSSPAQPSANPAIAAL